MSIISREEKLDGLLEDIQSASGYNLLEKTRKRNVIEPRALVFYVMNKHYRMNDRQICKWFKDKGLVMDRSTIFHAIKRCDDYRFHEKYLDDIYIELYPSEKPLNKLSQKEEQNRINLIRGDYLDELVRQIPKGKRGEVYDRVKLQMASWSWK